MSRPLRTAPGGMAFHVLNRANARLPMFRKDADYEAFERILAEALEHVPGMRLLAYCLMPNHWHLVVWPRADGELSDFAHWPTLTHTQRWLWRRAQADAELRKILADWPVARPRAWLTLVNRAQTDAELESVRRCIARGQPFGGDDWTQRVAQQLGLESTLRRRGRPSKKGS